MIGERLLQVRQLLAVGQPFDGAHLGTVGLHPEDQAGPHRRAVQDHRARPADAVLAAEMGTGVAEVVPEHVGQRPARLDDQLVLAAVDVDGDGVHVFHGPAPAWFRAALRSCGSTGMWSKRTSVSDSASLMAPSTAAGAPIVPPSPIPFAPVSLN